MEKVDEYGSPRNAYFVMGPESAGNRMMTRAINSAYDFGAGGHEGSNYKAYLLKTNWVRGGNIIKSLVTAPNRIVLSRSIPRRGWPKKEWPPIAEYCQAMKDNDYNIYAIIMNRNIKCLIKSQVRRKHVPNEEIAEEYILKARDYIKAQLKKAGVWGYNIHYEDFVTSASEREYLFKEILRLNSAPKMEFYNANDKYQEKKKDGR